jgi:autotransporter-associated beta strand protein
VRATLSSLLFACTLVAGAEAQAQFTWTGNGANDNWNTPANWTPAGPPTAGADVTFTGAATPMMNIAATVGTLTKSGGGTLTISGTNALTINGGLTRTAGAINLNSGVVLGAAQTWSISGGTTTVNGVLSGAALTRAGAGGNLVLATANTFSALTVASGTVRATASNSLGSGPVTLAGGVITLNSATVLSLPNAVTATGNATLNVDSSASVRHVLSSLTTNAGITLTLAGNNQTTLAVTTLVTNGTLSTTNASPGVYVAGSLIANAPLVIRGAPANPSAAQQALGLHFITTLSAAAPIDGRGAAAANSTILGADGTVSPVFTGIATIVDATSTTGRLVLTPRTGAKFTVGAGAQLITSVGATGNPLQIRGDATGTVSFAPGFNALVGANGLNNVTLLGGGTWETNANVNLPASVTFSTAGSVWRTATNAQTFSGAVAQNADVSFDTESNLTLTGVLSGGGGNLLTKLGPGTLTLASTANTHTGDYAVNAGTLSITGNLAAGDVITVNSGGAVSGTGQTRNVTVANGGTYAPGVGGTGTLTTSGNLVLNNTSNVHFTLGTASTRGVVTGNLTLDGIFNIAAGPGLAPGSFVLFQVAGTITNNLPTFGPPPSGFNIGYRIVGNQVILDVIARPLAARTVSFSGTFDGKTAQLVWQASRETRTLGYRVWREERGTRVQVTRRLVEGSALRSSADLANGHQYSMEDTTSPTGGTYWIEAVGLDGQSDWIGPVRTQPGPVTSKSPASGATPPSSAQVAKVVTAPLPLNAEQTLNSQQVQLAAGPAAKVSVPASGMYRVQAESLFGAGVAVNAPIATLQVWSSGRPVAFSVSSSDGVHLRAGDSVEFYGHGTDTRYTDTLVYWITSGLGAGRSFISAPTSGAGLAPASYAETLEVRDHGIYFGTLKNGGQQKFFGPLVYNSPLDRTFSTPAIDLASNQPAQLRVSLQAVTTDNHLITVSVNGVAVGTLNWFGQTEKTATFAIPYGVLVAGDNQVQLQTNSDSDFSLEIFQQLTYQRLYDGKGQPLLFTAPGGSVVRLSGFTDDSTRILDVTDPDSPVAPIATRDSMDSAALDVAIPGSGSRTLYAFGEHDLISPVVNANVPSNWHASQGADLVIIGDGTLLPAVQRLVAQRQAEGLKVATVDVADAYDEFSYGAKDAYAIREFLRYASAHWTISPRYVFLIGNASFNPRNYPGFGTGADLVPAIFVETTFEEVASDDEFATFSSSLPSLAIGRLPFVKLEDVENTLTKTLSRQLATRQSKLLFVHDIDEPANQFSSYVSTVRAALPGWTSSTLGRVGVASDTQSAVDASLHAQLLSALADGPTAVTFLGHGEEPYWANPAVLDINDEASLGAMGTPSVVFAGTCRNGWFTDVGYFGADILAASLLRVDGGGAWAVWAAAGDAPSDDLPALAASVLHGALDEGLTVGDALVRAKSGVGNPDVRAVFHLFGDPSSRMVSTPRSGSIALPPPAVRSTVAAGCSTAGEAAPWAFPLMTLFLMLAVRRPQH